MTSRRVFTSADDIFQAYIKDHRVKPQSQKAVAAQLSRDVIAKFREDIRQIAASKPTESAKRNRKTSSVTPPE